MNRLSFDEREELSTTIDPHKEVMRGSTGHEYCPHGWRLVEPDRMEFRISLRCPECCELPHPDCPEGQHGDYLRFGFHNIILAQVWRFENLWRGDPEKFNCIVSQCRAHIQRKGQHIGPEARGFVKAIVRNFLIDLWRSAEADAGARGNPHKWLFVHLQHDAELQRIWRETLTPQEREAFLKRVCSCLAVLSGFDELPWRLVAEELRCAEKTARNRFNRAKDALLGAVSPIPCSLARVGRVTFARGERPYAWAPWQIPTTGQAPGRPNDSLHERAYADHCALMQRIKDAPLPYPRWLALYGYHLNQLEPDVPVIRRPQHIPSRVWHEISDSLNHWAGVGASHWQRPPAGGSGMDIPRGATPVPRPQYRAPANALSWWARRNDTRSSNGFWSAPDPNCPRSKGPENVPSYLSAWAGLATAPAERAQRRREVPTEQRNLTQRQASALHPMSGRKCKTEAEAAEAAQLGRGEKSRWKVTSYVVEVKSGKQAHGHYLCPSLRAAQECCEARGGQIVGEVVTKWGEYRYRPSVNERWGEWPAWKTDGEN